MTTDDPIWDELFHGCSFAAFITLSREQQGWPDSKAVKALAYSLYEAELARSQTADSHGQPPAESTRP